MENQEELAKLVTAEMVSQKHNVAR